MTIFIISASSRKHPQISFQIYLWKLLWNVSIESDYSEGRSYPLLLLNQQDNEENATKLLQDHKWRSFEKGRRQNCLHPR